MSPKSIWLSTYNYHEHVLSIPSNYELEEFDIAKPLRKHAQRLDRKDEFVIRIGNHATTHRQHSSIFDDGNVGAKEEEKVQKHTSSY